ncbi:hypothetical protein ABW19_dt0208585 [Dactylella cylindrospora]|nr:hypothetical protein ABW19_dt0208585 [Dactylella cylindrospora]
MKYFTEFQSIKDWQPDGSREGDALDVANTPLQERPVLEERDPFKLLVCHDFKGAYLPYEDSQGIHSEETIYSLEYLHLVSTFVYFSHHKVTIPPAPWINVMHKNGVRILGTFIVEPGSAAHLEALFEENAEGHLVFVKKLADMAAYYGFDGWLLNFEAEFPDGKFNLELVLRFVRELTEECQKKVPSSEVVWYDALTVDNHVDWQNGLSPANKPFFEASSGLFVNYGWRPLNQLLITAALSKLMNRNYDVYMGIDIFGRGTFGGGQWGVGTALAVIKPAQLSAAIFAPGWVFENFDGLNFEARNRKFWIDGEAADPELICRPVAEFAPAWEAGTNRFFYTNFNRAFGKEWHQSGRLLAAKPWIHLGIQSVLPTFYPANTDRLVWHLDDEVVYEGGHSLKVSYKPGGDSKRLYCKLYKLNMDYRRDLRLSFSYILDPAHKGRVAIYFNLKRFNGVIENHEIGLKVQEGWGTKDVMLDVGKTDEDSFGMKLVELGLIYIAPETPTDEIEVTAVRLGTICLSSYPQQKLPAIGKVFTGKLTGGSLRLNWALDYAGFPPAELAQEGVKSATTGEFAYFVVYKGLGSVLGVSHCLEFLVSSDIEENASYRVDGVAFDGRVVKGAWY